MGFADLAGGDRRPSVDRGRLPCLTECRQGTFEQAHLGERQEEGEGGFRPRWGDYATATIDPATGSIWLANEYIGQRCGLNEWLLDSTCGFTRSLFANWSTRITEIAA